MDWTEITIRVPQTALDAACAIANLTVPGGIYIEDYHSLEEEVREIAHIDLIDEQLRAKDRDHALIHLYFSKEENPSEAVAFLRARLEAERIPFEVERTTLREEDWAEGWKQFYHTMRIGKQLIVRPSWEDYEPAGDEVVLTLDPGMAFGTGTHHTTRMCLELLQSALHQGDRVLDIGCGSGILAVSCALLGAKNALGVDIDPLAVKVAQENAARNAVSDRVRFVCGDLADQVSGRFELVLANIVADVIIRLAPSVPKLLSDGGSFIASGIIAPRRAEVEAALQESGLCIIGSLVQSDWVALWCKAAN